MLRRKPPPVSGADGAGEVDPGLHHAAPDRLDCLRVRAIGQERGDIGHAAVHVRGAHRVTDRLALEDDRQVVLAVAGVSFVLVETPALVASPLLKEESRLLEEASVPGDPVQAREPHLHDLVAAHIVPAPGTEDATDQLRIAQGHVEQDPLPGGGVVGAGRLVEVAAVVQLVAHREIGPARFPANGSTCAGSTVRFVYR